MNETFLSVFEQLSSSVGGVRTVEGVSFVGGEFRSLKLLGLSGHRMRLADCDFTGCHIVPGTAVIDGDVELARVQFVDFKCGDSLRIGASVLMHEVTVGGAKGPSGLIVQQRSGLELKRKQTTETYALDIRRLRGSARVVGIPADKVLCDPKRHIKFRPTTVPDEEWGKHGIADDSVWRIAARRVLGSDVPEGVFSAPKKSHKRFEQEMRELEILRELGVAE